MSTTSLLTARLTGVEKVAILLLSLGDKVASSIFDHLSDPEVRDICRCMMQMGHIPREVAEQVVAQFEQKQKDIDSFNGAEFAQTVRQWLREGS